MIVTVLQEATGTLGDGDGDGVLKMWRCGDADVVMRRASRCGVAVECELRATVSAAGELSMIAETK